MQAGAEDAALRAVDACRARLDPRVDIGIERVERRCPELLAGAGEGAMARPAAEHARRASRRNIGRKPASAGGSRQARQRRGRRAAPRRILKFSRRCSPSSANRGSRARHAGSDSRAGWSRNSRSGEDKEEAGWLERWSRQLRTPEGVAQAITYIGYTLVIALVLFVIGSELRAAGLLGGMRRGGRRSSPAAEWRRRLMLADVLAAPPVGATRDVAEVVR